MVFIISVLCFYTYFIKIKLTLKDKRLFVAVINKNINNIITTDNMTDNFSHVTCTYIAARTKQI